MNTEDFRSLRSTLPRTASLLASLGLVAVASAQTAVPGGPSNPPPYDAVVPASGSEYYSQTPVSTESIGMQQDRFGGTQAPITAPAVAADQGEVLDGLSIYNRPGMSPTQYGIAIALHEMAATNPPQRVLDADAIATSFLHAPFESRAAFTVYSERVNVASNSLDSLQAKAVQFGGDTPSLRSDEQTVRDRRLELNRCLVAAENATADTWDQARRNLADSYRRYGEAVAHASVAASR
jgi:hypothetical protein